MGASISERQLRYSTIVVLFTLVLFAMTSNVVFSSLGRVSATFGVPSELFSIAVSVQFVGYVVTCLLIGIISDRFGKKRMLIGSCVAAALGALGWTVSPYFSEPVAFCLRLFGSEPSMEAVAVCSVSIGALLLGGGGGVLEGMGSAILTDLHPDKSKFYMNLSQIAYCVGAIIPTMIVGRLYPMGLSWQWAFTAVALSSVAMAAVCFPMCLPET
ncbi:MAG: MFS transporter, partial [Victivallales bacterium]|nr:MFS transporter [Victivallales bacterium]